jgi:hypothetical protein
VDDWRRRRQLAPVFKMNTKISYNLYVFSRASSWIWSLITRLKYV